MLVLSFTAGQCLAQDAAELAKKTQDPVSDLISVPFQNNFNFTTGRHDDLQYILNIQPVVPFHITEDWTTPVGRRVPRSAKSAPSSQGWRRA